MLGAHSFSRLDPDRIEAGLGTQVIGRQIQFWNQVPSTNDLALKAAALSANCGLVILADEQTAGRGQHGRRWIAPAGSSLLISVVLHPVITARPGSPITPGSLSGALICLSAVAVARTIEPDLNRSVSFKWPNDLYLDGRKLGGILVEQVPADVHRSERPAETGVVIGIGLNVHRSPPDDPPLLATHLEQHLSVPPDRSDLVRRLLREMDRLYQQLCQGDWSEIVTGWRERSIHLGQPVSLRTAAGPVSGTVRSLDPVHGACLQLAGGLVREIPAAELLGLEPLS